MSPCEAALAEIRSTTCNNVEKRLCLEAKGAVRRLGEIHGVRFVRVASVLLRYLTVKLKIFFGGLLRAEDQRELIAFKSDRGGN